MANENNDTPSGEQEEPSSASDWFANADINEIMESMHEQGLIQPESNISDIDDSVDNPPPESATENDVSEDTWQKIWGQMTQAGALPVSGYGSPTSYGSVIGGIGDIGNYNVQALDPQYESFTAQVKAGELPAELMEMYRFIDPSEPSAIEFQKKMEEIAGNLFKDSNATKHKFRFLISDEAGLNAGVISQANPPIISFSKDYIQTMDSEDKWAAALAHELTHQAIYDRIGPNKNSNLQEAGADAWGVKLLQNGGYNPYAMLEMMQILEDAVPSDLKKFHVLDILDEHPPHSIRIRNINNAIALIEQNEELNQGKSHPIDPALQESVKLLTHNSFLDDLLAQHNYELLGTAAKIGVLEDILDNIMIKAHPKLHTVRINDFCDAIHELSPEISGHELKLEAIANKLLVYSGSKATEKHSGTLYTAIAETLHEDYQLVGDISELPKAMQQFVDAETREDALQAAIIINQLADTYPVRHSSILENHHFPQFVPPLQGTIESGEVTEFPWNKHIDWALEDLQSLEIARALKSFSLHDPRMSILPETKTIQIASNIQWDQYFYEISDLDIDSHGSINGFKQKESNRFAHQTLHLLREAERIYLDELDLKAETVLAEIDWGMLENDFSGFIETYRELLLPQITVTEGGQLFAEAFIEKVSVLYSNNPEKYGPDLKKFFEHENIGQPPSNTLASMASEFETRFDKSAGMRVLNVKEINSLSSHRGFSSMYRPPEQKAQFGLAVDHPYMTFGLSLPDDIVSKQSKVTLLGGTRYRKSMPENSDDMFHVNYRDALGYDKPTTPEELYDVLETLQSLKYDYSNTSAVRQNSLIENLCYAELYAYLTLENTSHLDLARIEQYEGINFLNRSNTNFIGGHEDTHRKAFFKALEQQVRHNAPYDMRQGAPIDELIASYSLYGKKQSHGHTLLSRTVGLQSQYEEAIQTRIDDLPITEERLALVERLLFDTDLSNPSFRTWAVDRWVADQAELLGHDTKNQDYHDNVIAIASNVIENSQLGQSNVLLTGLLDAIQAQEKVSFAVKDQLIDNVLHGTENLAAGLSASVSDHLMANLENESADMRMSVLNFFTHPITSENTDAIYDDMKRFGAGSNNNFIQMIIEEERTTTFAFPEDVKKEKLDQLHKNFWSLPFPARAHYLDRVLFPVNDNSPENFDKAVTYVMDTLLPEDQPFASDARNILNAYMDEVSQPLQRLTFSALVSANEQSIENGQAMRPGQVLSMVLERSGTAGGKILQGIHSYLQTMDIADPELLQFRDDLKSSKTNYEKPFRWEVFERINDVMPQDIRTDIERVGELLGSGSYAYTVQVEKHNNDDTALTLLRPKAAKKAAYQFDRYGRIATKLAQEDDKWQALPSILEDAQQRADVEGNFIYSADQIAYQEQLRDGLSITKGDHEYTISTAELLNYGEEFKETRLAKGHHFNDIDPKDSAAIQQYHDTAQIAWTVGLYDMLRGKAFDQDQHGGNKRIDGTSINEFDHGAIPYDKDTEQVIEPTKSDKMVLGEILAQAVNVSHGEDVSLDNALVSQIGSTKQYGDAAPYIEHCKQHLLALSDYSQHMGDNAEQRNLKMQESVTAILKTGQVDHTILSTIQKNVEPDVLANMHSSMSDTDLTINDPHISLGAKAAVSTVAALGSAKKKIGKFFSKSPKEEALKEVEEGEQSNNRKSSDYNDDLMNNFTSRIEPSRDVRPRTLLEHAESQENSNTSIA